MTKRLCLILLLLVVISACVQTQPTPLPTQTTIPTLVSKPATPWWREAVFYEIFVRSFYDTNSDGIGDFNGITSKLDYLQHLGITAIWLMPIHPSPSYYGYDVLNYYAVNPEYGTMTDFKRLLSEAHKRNMHIIIDLVLNHTSDQHPFFKDALRGPHSKYHEWYVWSDSDQGRGWHAVTDDQQTYYFGQFCECMPDLNYRNPAVTAQMENVVKYWLEDVGVDGFRVDAAKHLIEEGQKIEHTKATHEWLKGFFQVYKADQPNAYTVGEVYGADASLAKTYTGNQLDEVFNFEVASGILNSVNGGSNAGVNSALTFAIQGFPDGDYATFLTNHDQNRVMSVLNGDLAKAKLVAFLLLTSPGVPFIYYGEEIGMQGEKPDELIRTPMQWISDKGAGFTSGTPWEQINSDFTTVNVAKQTGDSTSLLEHYRKLIQLRNAHSALSVGTTYVVDSKSNKLASYLRASQDEIILTVTNLGDQPVTDYGLDLEKGPLSGNYTAKSLLDDVAISPLQANKTGGFNAYTPLPEIPPYGTLIAQLTRK